MKTQALLIIDLQNDYFPGGRWVLSEIDNAAKNASRLLAKARESGQLVIHIKHEALQADAPFFSQGTTGAQINAIVQNRSDELVIVKNYVNSFRETNLKKILDQHAIENITICGAMSHLCVEGATRAAHDFGYSCTVVHDACAAREVDFDGTIVPAKNVHAATMAALQFGYAKVVSTAEYLEAN